MSFWSSIGNGIASPFKLLRKPTMATGRFLAKHGVTLGMVAWDVISKRRKKLQEVDSKQDVAKAGDRAYVHEQMKEFVDGRDELIEECHSLPEDEKKAAQEMQDELEKKIAKLIGTTIPAVDSSPKPADPEIDEETEEEAAATAVATATGASGVDPKSSTKYMSIKEHTIDALKRYYDRVQKRERLLRQGMQRGLDVEADEPLQAIALSLPEIKKVLDMHEKKAFIPIPTYEQMLNAIINIELKGRSYLVKKHDLDIRKKDTPAYKQWEKETRQYAALSNAMIKDDPALTELFRQHDLEVAKLRQNFASGVFISEGSMGKSYEVRPNV